LNNIIQNITDYCSANFKHKTHEDELKIIAFIQVWISTTIIMWCYVVFSFSIFEDSTVGILGLTYTIIHTLTPVIYRYTTSLPIAGLTISISALLFQITFCIYNGGIYSPSAIWFTAHPVIISFFASKRLIIVSVVLNVIVVMGLTLLGNQGIFPVDTLSSSLTQTMMISSLIGLDIIIATYTVVFITKTQTNEKELSNRNILIENLMRIISHDINNALTTSMLAAGSLENDITSDTSVKKLNLINRSNKQINEITNSVRDWIMANDESITLNKENVVFSEVVTYLSDNFKEKLEEKKIILKLKNNIPEDTIIVTDGHALRYQILNNLINNAIKFSKPSSEIIFEANIIRNQLILKVIDTGIGVSQKNLKTIFDPSSGNSTRGTAGEAGTGFGLPIVNTIVKLLKGDISIVSATQAPDPENRGTAITVTLPLA
jgi:signal transduction histidine kinase